MTSSILLTRIPIGISSTIGLPCNTKIRVTVRSWECALILESWIHVISHMLLVLLLLLLQFHFYFLSEGCHVLFNTFFNCLIN
jgi:hypothetical protein